MERKHDRKFVRTFFTSPTAVEGEDDSAKMMKSAAQLRGMQAPDVWVPDNEDATAPNMRDEGAQNIIDVVSEHGADFPAEIHPRVVWHRDSPETRYQGFQHLLEIADPDNGAIQHIDGFVIPEVGDIDDWKKADEFLTIVENEHGLEEGSIAMSVIIECGASELAMEELRTEIGRPSNNLQRLFMLVNGDKTYMVRQQNGQWVAMDMAAMGQMMQQMRQQSGQQSPAQVEQGSGDVQFRDTGRTETIAGYEGSVYEVTSNDETQEVVLSDHEDIIALSQAWMEFAGKMTQQMGALNEQMEENLLSESDISNHGGMLRLSDDMRVKSVSNDSKGSDYYELPAGTKVQDMGNMMRGR